MDFYYNQLSESIKTFRLNYDGIPKEETKWGKNQVSFPLHFVL